MEIQSGIDLTGKVAVVTGAGRGLGATIARAFAEAGADIVVADLNNESAQQTAHRQTNEELISQSMRLLLCWKE